MRDIETEKGIRSDPDAASRKISSVKSEPIHEDRTSVKVALKPKTHPQARRTRLRKHFAKKNMNLSITLPNKEKSKPKPEPKEFKHGNLIITEDGLKEFEPSPLGFAPSQSLGSKFCSVRNVSEQVPSSVDDEHEMHSFNSQNNEQQLELWKAHNVQQTPKKRLFLKKNLRFSDFERVKKLGTGASSVVWLVRHRPTNSLYAMKTLSLDPQLYHDHYQTVTAAPHYPISPAMVYDEIEALLHSQKSSYIINLLQAYYESEKYQIHLLLEYVDGNSLEHLLLRRKQLPEYILSIITNQLLGALQFLHPKIMHMDIKPANILISSTGRVFISDFGTMVKQKRLFEGDSEAQMRYAELGTVLFWPPERARNLPFDYRSDIWNLGITLFYLRTGKHPFEDLTQGQNINSMPHFAIREMIEELDVKKLLYDHYSKDFSPEFADFLQRCLQKDPGKRPSADDLQKHAFIHNHKSAWSQNSGEDRVRNYLHTDELHIEDELVDHEGKKMKFAQRKSNSSSNIKTRNEEIVERIVNSRKQSDSVTINDYDSADESVVRSSASPENPSQSEIYLEFEEDKLEELENLDISNLRIKKRLHGKKNVSFHWNQGKSSPNNSAEKRKRVKGHRHTKSLDMNHTPLDSKPHIDIENLSPETRSSEDDVIPIEEYTGSPHVKRAQKYINKYLPSGDIYERKQQKQYQKLLRKLTKEEQSSVEQYFSRMEEESKPIHQVGQGKDAPPFAELNQSPKGKKLFV